MAVGITVTHRTKPGQRDKVRQVWDRFMPQAVAANPSHLFYAYTFDNADPDVIRAFQVYDDAEAATAYLQNDSYKLYVEAVEPFLAGPPDVTTGQIIWAKDGSHARR